jgi:hypothetical protein
MEKEAKPSFRSKNHSVTGYESDDKVNPKPSDFWEQLEGDYAVYA